MFAFGYVFILIIAVFIYRSHGYVEKMFVNFLTLELVFSINRINMGYFIKIGGSELEYNDVLLGILFFISLFLFACKGTLNRKLFQSTIALIIIIVIGIILLILVPSSAEVIDYSHSWDSYFRGDSSQLTSVSYTSQTIMMAFRVVIFVFILNIARVLIDKKTWLEIGEKVLRISNIIIFYGIIEAILKLGLNYNITTHLVNFMGRGVATGGGVSRLQGLCREPAYYALALFNVFMLTLAINTIKGKNKVSDYKWAIATVILGIVSTSFSYLVCLVSIAVAVYVVYKDKIGQWRKIIEPLGIITIIIISLMLICLNLESLTDSMDAEGWLSRIITSVTVIKKTISGTIVLGDDFSSEAARLGGAILSIKAGLSRPLFGLGIGTVYCVAGLPSIFANVGLLGLFVWFYMTFVCYPEKTNLFITLVLLVPVLFCNDLYTLYDTSYVLLVPLLGQMVEAMDAQAEVSLYDE